MVRVILVGSQMSEFSVVLFDLGNVLIEWDQDRLLRRIFADTGTTDTPELRQLFKGWNDEWDACSMGDGCKIQQELYPQYKEVIQAYNEQWTVSLGFAIEGTVSVMRHLKSCGYRIYAASNFASDKFEIARERMPFLDEFDGVQISGTLGIKKPDVRFFEQMVERFSFCPSEALYIDDLSANILAACELGIVGIQFQDPVQLKEEIQALGIL